MAKTGLRWLKDKSGSWHLMPPGHPVRTASFVARADVDPYGGAFEWWVYDDGTEDVMLASGRASTVTIAKARAAAVVAALDSLRKQSR